MRSIVVVLVVGMVVAACGGDGGRNDAMPFQPIAPDAVVLEVRDEGGFAPVEFILGRPPRYVLTADRRLWYQGPVPEIFPGPLLPNIQGVRVADGDWEDIVRAVDQSSLPYIDRVENRDAASTVADATDTIFTLFDTEGEHVYVVYGLGIGATASSSEIVALEQLIADLDEATVNGEPLGRFETDRFEIRVNSQVPGFDPQFITRRSWPLTEAPTSLADGFGGWRCAVIEGAELVSLVSELDAATQTTLWEFEGTDWSMIARPLFPHETGCR